MRRLITFITLLFVVIIALDFSAHAAPFRGGASSTCGTGGSVLGASINAPPCPTSFTLLDSHGNVWQYDLTQATPPNYDMACCGPSLKVVLGSPPAGGFFSSAYYTIAGYFEYSEEGNLYWFCLCSFGNAIQSVGPGVGMVGNFLNVTQGKPFASFGEMLSTVGPGYTINPGDVMEVKPMAATVPAYSCYPASSNPCVVGGTNLTINFDSGVKFVTFNEALNGRGMIVMTGTGTTLNGGDFSGSADNAWRVSDNSPNGTFKNAALHNEGDSCFLSGANEGTITLTNMLVYNCATNVNNSGQAHNVYLSSAQGSGVTDVTCEAITNLTSLNINNDGHSLKLRPVCPTAQQGFTTNSVLGCTLSSCRQNAIIDYPCAGFHSVTHGVNELGPGQVPSSDGGSWYLMKYGEEIVRGGCPGATLSAATNTLTFNLDYWISDAPNPGSNHMGLCLLDTDGGTPTSTTCAPSLQTGFACHLTNSVLVSNLPTSYAMIPGGCNDAGAGCTLVPNDATGSCTDSNNNRWYGSRTAAATGEHWSGTYTDPTSGAVYPCCAWPWLPPPM